MFDSAVWVMCGGGALRLLNLNFQNIIKKKIKNTLCLFIIEEFNNLHMQTL